MARVTRCVRAFAMAAPVLLLPFHAMADGARVKTFDAFQMVAIRSLEILNPARTRERYGVDAAAGAVVATTDATTLARFSTLGYTPSRIANVMSLKQRAGLMGPKATYITVFYLK